MKEFTEDKSYERVDRVKRTNKGWEAPGYHEKGYSFLTQDLKGEESEQHLERLYLCTRGFQQAAVPSRPSATDGPSVLEGGRRKNKYPDLTLFLPPICQASHQLNSPTTIGQGQAIDVNAVGKIQNVI